MKQEKTAQTHQLHDRRKKFEQRLAQLQNHVHFLQIRVDGKKQQLAEHDTHQTLLQLEGKIAQYEQNLFHMQSFITAKQSEADFTGERNSVLACAEKINAILIQNCLRMPPKQVMA